MIKKIWNLIWRTAFVFLGSFVLIYATLMEEGMTLVSLLIGAILVLYIGISGKRPFLSKVKKKKESGLPITSKKNCPKCKAEITKISKYCKACGAKLMKKCPGCKKELDAFAKFCEHCGHKFEDMIKKGRKEKIKTAKIIGVLVAVTLILYVIFSIEYKNETSARLSDDKFVKQNIKFILSLEKKQGFQLDYTYPFEEYEKESEPKKEYYEWDFNIENLGEADTTINYKLSVFDELDNEIWVIMDETLTSKPGDVIKPDNNKIKTTPIKQMVDDSMTSIYTLEELVKRSYLVDKHQAVKLPENKRSIFTGKMYITNWHIFTDASRHVLNGVVLEKEKKYNLKLIVKGKGTINLVKEKEFITV